MLHEVVIPSGLNWLPEYFVCYPLVLVLLETSEDSFPVHHFSDT